MADLTHSVLNLLFGDSPPQRTLLVLSTHGLGARLRILLSGLTLAADSDRTFIMLWPRTSECGATFEELFRNPHPVVEAPAEFAELACFDLQASFRGRLTDVVRGAQNHVMVNANYWLLPPRQKKAWAASEGQLVKLVNGLAPAPSITASMEAFRSAHFHPKMIGVHLRRGDFIPYQPRSSQNLDSALLAVDHFLGFVPDAGILLCTDDGAITPQTGQTTQAEGVRAAFQQRYGQRVLTFTSRSLDRRQPEAIQDALAELWLLRATDYFVGTQGSTFSGMAVFGRSVPRIFCPVATPEEDRLGEKVHDLRLGGLVRLAARIRLRQDLPFPLAWRWFIHLRKTPTRCLRRLTRSVIGRG
jgi:hypothetical protein